MFWIAAIVGLLVGMFGFPNIVLPVVWSWPKARRLQREGKLTKPIPIRLLLLAPVVWGAGVVVSQLLLVVVAPSLSFGYGTGLWLGFFKTLWALVSAKDKALMEAAFADQWREYLR
jgi:hypothetical protein